MGIINKSLTLIVIFFLQISFAQDVYEIDDYNGQTIEVCEGVFEDSNFLLGPNGTGYIYDQDENYTITFCPQGDDQSIELDFNFFTTQANADILTIYDGPDNTYPSTPHSGGPSSSPGFVSATNSSGCLTIEWNSDGVGQTYGWSADISCFEPCQEITNPTITSNPSLNGSILSVDVDQEMQMQISHQILQLQYIIGILVMEALRRVFLHNTHTILLVVI